MVPPYNRKITELVGQIVEIDKHTINVKFKMNELNIDYVLIVIFISKSLL